MEKKEKKEWKIDQEAWILRGSIVRLRRKCGQKKCRCINGALHETWALSVKVKGRTQLVTLQEEDLPMIKMALVRYRKARRELEGRVQKAMVILRRCRRQKRKLS